MNDNDNMLKNIDRISRIISANGGNMDTDKILNAISAAKNMGILSNSDNEKNNYEVQTENRYEEPIEYYNPNENMRIIKAAIPFLDREYQKSLFLAIKLMEMNREFDNGAMSLQCQSIREETSEKQREAMLKAIRGQMCEESGRRLDMVLKMMEVRKMTALMQKYN